MHALQNIFEILKWSKHWFTCSKDIVWRCRFDKFLVENIAILFFYFFFKWKNYRLKHLCKSFEVVIQHAEKRSKIILVSIPIWRHIPHLLKLSKNSVIKLKNNPPKLLNFYIFKAFALFFNVRAVHCVCVAQVVSLFLSTRVEDIYKNISINLSVEAPTENDMFWHVRDISNTSSQAEHRGLRVSAWCRPQYNRPLA